MFYTSSDIKSLHLFKDNPVFSTIDELYEKLVDIGWDEMSCFSKSQWDPSNKCRGQCNATVLLVQEFFGGDIIEYPNPCDGKSKHFFNRINGVDVDLTSEQFFPRLRDYSSMTKIAHFSGIYGYQYEKSAYIIKLKLGIR